MTKRKKQFLQHKKKNTKRILHRQVKEHRKEGRLLLPQEASINTAKMTAMKIALKETPISLFKLYAVHQIQVALY